MSKYPLPPGSAAFEVVNAFLPARKINYVVKFLTNPCAAPWYVYVETALPALLHALITYNTFGLSDISRNALGRSQQRWNRRLFAGWNKYAPHKRIGPKGFLFKIDGAAQRLLWWWLVADITVDFFYEWTSLVQKTEWCTGHGIIQKLQPSGAFPAAAIYSPFNINLTTQNKNNWATTSVHVSLPGGSYHCILTMEPMFNSVLNFGTDFQLAVRVVAAGLAQIEETEELQLKVGVREDVGVAFSFTVPSFSGATISWFWRYKTTVIPLIDHGEINLIVSQDAISPP